MAQTLADLESGEEFTLPPPDGGGDTDVLPGGDTPTTPKRRGRPPGSGGGTSKAKLAQLEESVKEKLLEDMVLPGAFVSPLVAANIEARAERTAKAVARIAAKNPAVRKSVERAIEGSDYLTIVMFFATCAIAGMVDFGMMHPNSIPARAAGVPELWETVYTEEPEAGDVVPIRGRGLLGEVDE
jgi:hypothetical protein